MTDPRDKLTEIGQALYGRDWKAPLGRVLQVDDRTIRRWMAGSRRLPWHRVEQAARLLVENRDNRVRVAKQTWSDAMADLEASKSLQRNFVGATKPKA